MKDQLILIACCIFIGMLALIAIVSTIMYHIGQNNGYNIGYKDGRKDWEQTQITYSLKPLNNRYVTDSVKVLTPETERPVYIDGRSKYNISKSNY